MGSTQEKTNSDDGSSARRDLRVSLCLLGLLMAFVLSGLARDENWPKFARILIAFSAYIIVLLSALRASALIARERRHTPFWVFALAAGVAEMSSGWLRPTARGPVDFTTAIAAALLIGGIHWLALYAWRPLRQRIVSNEHR